MKAMLVIMTCLIFLSACGGENTAMDQAMEIRSRLEKSGCEFIVAVTADYKERTYQFKLDCVADDMGNINFSVIEPETISGISGSIAQDSGQLSFDDKVLMFPILSDGLPSPVSAPYILLKALKSGYISTASQQDSGLKIQLDDTYHENSLMLDVMTNKDLIPCFAEIYWQGYRIITMSVENFRYL